MNLYDLRNSVQEELMDTLKCSYDPSDFESARMQERMRDEIHEIVDGAVPIYTSDLLTLAADYNSLATSEPEFGPAFSGEPTPVNIIAANVYEDLYEVASETFREMIDNIDEYGCTIHDVWLDDTEMCLECNEEEEMENVSVTSTKSSAIGWSPAEEFFGDSIKVSHNGKRSKSKIGCATCQTIGDGFGPSHDAMPTCRSGGYNHCTCDTCF